MAQEAKTNESSNLKYEDVINVDDELKKRADMIAIALTPIDDSWTQHNTKNDNVSVAFKQIGDSNVYTVRGVMNMKGDMDLYFKYQECGYDDVYVKALESE